MRLLLVCCSLTAGGLLQGRPGVGKTTVIREMARLLSVAHDRRVVIVDTSNEIGGDGDIAHSGIGRARRMQVLPCSILHHPGLASNIFRASLLRKMELETPAGCMSGAVCACRSRMLQSSTGR